MLLKLSKFLTWAFAFCHFCIRQKNCTLSSICSTEVFKNQ